MELDINENQNRQDTSVKAEGVQNMDFMLFLILILLLMSNQKSFGTYFETLDGKLSNITNFINTLNATANGLQGVFNAADGFKL